MQRSNEKLNIDSNEASGWSKRQKHRQQQQEHRDYLLDDSLHAEAFAKVGYVCTTNSDIAGLRFALWKHFYKSYKNRHSLFCTEAKWFDWLEPDSLCQIQSNTVEIEWFSIGINKQKDLSFNSNY